ncbi:MAG: hypothetical protein ABI904_05365 [Chloroflexota bacterium]
MKKLISIKLAGNLLLISFGLLAIFDILILFNVLPSNIVWGGQIKDQAANLIVLELIALVVTFIFAIVIAAKMDYIKAGRFTKAVNIGVWIIFAYLILNTLGNLASGVSFENLIFAPITLALAFCAFRLAIEK